MTYSIQVLVFAVVFSQMLYWNWKNCTVHAEVESSVEDKSESDEHRKSTNGKGDKTCYGPYFREFCSEESPCCFYDGKNHTCKPAREEGEECTHNALGYNTNFCFCKAGLFCVGNKCTTKEPTDTNQKSFDMFKKK